MKANKVGMDRGGMLKVTFWEIRFFKWGPTLATGPMYIKENIRAKKLRGRGWGLIAEIVIT